MAEHTLFTLFVPPDVASQVQHMEGVAITEKRDSPDEALRMGAHELVELLIHLAPALSGLGGLTTFVLGIRTLLKKSEHKDQPALLRSVKDGTEVEIYVSEEEVVLRRKVERVFRNPH
jgi:hypothetical protein